MARHEFRTAVGGSIINHGDRRSGILTVPNHRWQTLLQQVSGVEIQDDDIYGWGWKNHLKKHGNLINTTWTKLFYDIDELVKVSLILSNILNIIESKNWANMRLEDGLSGGDTSNSENYKQGMLKYHLSLNPKDYATFGMKGKKQSEKFISAIKESNNCPVICENKKYNSIKEAQIDYPNISVRKRLDNPKYPTFYRLREKTKRK